MKLLDKIKDFLFGSSDDELTDDEILQLKELIVQNEFNYNVLTVSEFEQKYQKIFELGDGLTLLNSKVNLKIDSEYLIIKSDETRPYNNGLALINGLMGISANWQNDSKLGFSFYANNTDNTLRSFYMSDPLKVERRQHKNVITYSNVSNKIQFLDASRNKLEFDISNETSKRIYDYNKKWDYDWYWAYEELVKEEVLHFQWKDIIDIDSSEARMPYSELNHIRLINRSFTADGVKVDIPDPLVEVVDWSTYHDEFHPYHLNEDNYNIFVTTPNNTFFHIKDNHIWIGCYDTNISYNFSIDTTFPHYTNIVEMRGIRYDKGNVTLFGNPACSNVDCDIGTHAWIDHSPRSITFPIYNITYLDKSNDPDSFDVKFLSSSQITINVHDNLVELSSPDKYDDEHNHSG